MGVFDLHVADVDGDSARSPGRDPRGVVQVQLPRSAMASDEARGTPELLIDGIVPRGAYDATALMWALSV